jgi:RHS repeat-associated protein
VQKIAGGLTRKFTYDGEDILREKVVGVGNLRYIHGPGIDDPLAHEELATGAMTYYHADGLGSIVKTTDSSGTVTLTRTYDSFGIPSDGATTPGYAYTGREWDPETGLYYYRARYFDPKIGRFISEDPIGFEGG